MSIGNPYYRIVRLNKQGGGYYADYAIDNRNILDWSSSIRAYNLLIDDFKKICEYVDPSEENSAVYSHRIYEVFIRACMEFESNAKGILKANGYVKIDKNKKIIDENYWNIDDYKKLSPVLKLSEYEVLINFWDNGRGGEISPFNNLADGESGVLVWYQDYNKVKHNREKDFNLASFSNLLNALCGVFIILFSQYGVQVFNSYHNVTNYDDEGGLDKIIYQDSSIFGIKTPDWNDNEKYDFDWNVIKDEENPFIKYNNF